MSRKGLFNARRDKTVLSSVPLGLFSPVHQSTAEPIAFTGSNGARVPSSQHCTQSQLANDVHVHTLSNGSNSSNDQRLHVHQPKQHYGDGGDGDKSEPKSQTPPARPLPFVVFTWVALLVALAKKHMPSPRRLLAVLLCCALAWLVFSCAVEVPQYARSSVGEQTLMLLCASVLPQVDRLVRSYFGL